MRYLKSFFFQFLIVFFANLILPDVTVGVHSKLPNFGMDFPFALALGFLNFLIYPVLKLLHKHSWQKMLIASFLLNFGVYAILKILPIEVQVESVKGYFLVSTVVALGCFAVNFFEMKHHSRSSGAL